VGWFDSPFDAVANIATLGAYDALDLSGNKAKNAALSSQSQGTNQANNVLSSELKNQQGYLQPWQDAGSNALSTLTGGSSSIMNNWQQDPGYQFRMQEGQNAINNGMAARGLGNSGAALKALTNYNQNLASSEYDKIYNRKYANLSQLAGYGQDATNSLVNSSANYGNTVSGNYTGLANANAAAQISQSNRNAQLIGQGLGAGAMLLASDKRMKKHIEPIPKAEIEDLKKELRAFYYEYKDKLLGEGRWIGIMAQDLEKSKLGREIVVEKDGIKMIDINRVMSIFLATMAEA